MSRQGRVGDGKYAPESYGLFYIWLSFFASAAVFYCTNPTCIPYLNAGKTLGTGIFIMLDLLFGLIFVTRCVYWISGITYEQAKKAGTCARRRYAGLHLLVYAAATVLYLVYGFGGVIRLGGVMQDSLAAGGLVCAAVLCAKKIPLV